MGLKIGAGLGYGGDPRGAAKRVKNLESASVDVVWVAELYSFDAVSLMGYIAALTERIEIGSSILPFYSRTPTLLAMSAAGVDALSGGRCILGIGASGPQVIEGWHGVEYDAPIARTREIIDICRKVWRREVVVHDGEKYQLPLPEGRGTGLAKPLKIINHPVRDDIPIYVAALGPKNLEMTAELADGWQPAFFWPDKAQEVFGDSIAAGLKKRDPSRPPMEVVAGGRIMVGENLEHLRDAGRPGMALYIGGMGARSKNFYNQLCRRYGFEAEAEEIQELYLSGKKKEAEAAVPQELVDGMSLIGPEGWVKERLSVYKEAGVTTLNCGITGPDAARTLEQIRGWWEDA